MTIERTFNASTLHEAMQQAKTALGPHAIVLGTREIASEHGNKRVEVTARVDVSEHTESDGGELRDISSALGELRSLRSSWQNGLASQERLRMQLAQLVERFDINDAPARPFPAVAEDAPMAHPCIAHLPHDIGRTLTVRAQRRARQEDRALTTEDIRAEITASLPIAGPLWNRNERTVAAFVGPTGVGKTATVVKLAGIAAFKHNKRVAVITTDGYRIGQFKTLKSYCQMLDIPVIEAPDRDRLKEAAKSLVDKDLILIDTPGHNPWDEEARQKVMQAIHFADVEIHLVLSATARDEDLRDITASYSAGKIASIVMTKLDETRRSSAILSAIWTSGFGLSHVADGREIPEAIHAADAENLTRRILSPNPTPPASVVALQAVPC